MIYLDYAATSAVRPAEVIDAVAGYLRDVGATPGRSGHSRSLAAGRIALRCRRLLAELLGVEGDPGRIVFQLNATQALNTALFGILSPGDLVVRTRYDHNSVRRPIAALTRRGAREAVLDLDSAGRPDLDRVRDLLRGNGHPARLLVVPHASNVTGAVLPVAELAEVAHECGALVLVDAAQTVGHLPVDVTALGADMLAFTGHKGVPGPQGVGGLWVREGVEVAPLVFGGTGGDSALPEMPEAFPDHLEAGTQNAPGLAGLAAAAEWVLARGVPKLRAEEVRLKQRLLEALEAMPRVQIRSPVNTPAVGIVTLLVDGMRPGDLAVALERRWGIQARAGLHCAPGAHEALGTLETGALRLSLGWATTADEIDRTIAAFGELSAEGGTD